MRRLQSQLRGKECELKENIALIAGLERQFSDFKRGAVTFINERLAINFCEQLHFERRERETSEQTAQLEVPCFCIFVRRSLLCRILQACCSIGKYLLITRMLLGMESEALMC